MVDALDEYFESEAERDCLLAEIQLLGQVSSIMLISRFIFPFMEALQNAIHLTIFADNGDVQQFLRSQMPTLPKCVRSKPVLQELIRATITEAVEEMYVFELFYPYHLSSIPQCF